jgi:hypothetical protein
VSVRRQKALQASVGKSYRVFLGEWEVGKGNGQSRLATEQVQNWPVLTLAGKRLQGWSLEAGIA